MIRTFLYSLILLVGVFLSSVSQVMLKKASIKGYDTALKMYLNPFVITAYIIFAGTTLLSVLAYRGIPLSLGPVIEASGYIFVSFWGVKLFGEKMTKKKILAIFFIFSGIIIYSIP